MPDTPEIFISRIAPENAPALHTLMVSNSAYFQPYFPATVAINTSLRDSTMFIKEILEDSALKKQYLYTITYKGELIGLVYIKELDWENNQGELAYCIAENFSRKGIISKAIQHITSLAFTKLNIKNLVIIAHKTNIGSIKAAENCGFTHTKTLKNEFTPTGGKPLDMELYELRK